MVMYSRIWYITKPMINIYGSMHPRIRTHRFCSHRVEIRRIRPLTITPRHQCVKFLLAICAVVHSARLEVLVPKRSILLLRETGNMPHFLIAQMQQNPISLISAKSPNTSPCHVTIPPQFHGMLFLQQAN